MSAPRKLPKLAAALLLLAAAALLLAAAPAAANIAAVRVRSAPVTAPWLAGPTPLRVESERLSFRCTEDERALRCDFDARYRVTNPTAATEAVTGAFYGRAGMTRDVTIRAEGADASAGLQPETVAALDAALRATDREDGPNAGWMGDSLTRAGEVARWGFRLAVPPGKTIELTATGRLEGGVRFVPRGYAIPPVQSRHLELGGDVWPVLQDLAYWLAPLGTWAGSPEIEIELRLPSSWRLVDEGWRVERLDGELLARRTATAADGVLRIAFERPAPNLVSGGPVLAIGGAAGTGSGLRARAAWEVGVLPNLLASVGLEFGWPDQVVVAPVLMAATSMVMFVPSVGAGVGLPVKLGSDPRAGVRLQFDAMLGPVGLVASFDWYDGSQGHAEQTWAAQVAF